MSVIGSDVVLQQLLALLGEAMDGPAGSSSWFTDNAPGSGFLGSIASLNAAEASRPLGGSSIASHVNHVRFGLEVSAAWIQGDRTLRDWSESWRVTQVDDARWASLLEDLRAAHENLRAAVAEHALDSAESVAGAMAALAHVAAHLGAVRQKLAFRREGFAGGGS